MHANPNGGSINNIRVSEWRSVDDCVPACLPAKRNVMERKGSPGFSDPPPVAVIVAGPGFYAFCAATRVLSSCSAWLIVKFIIACNCQVDQLNWRRVVIVSLVDSAQPKRIALHIFEMMLSLLEFRSFNCGRFSFEVKLDTIEKLSFKEYTRWNVTQHALCDGWAICNY